MRKSAAFAPCLLLPGLLLAASLGCRGSALQKLDGGLDRHGDVGIGIGGGDTALGGDLASTDLSTVDVSNVDVWSPPDAADGAVPGTGSFVVTSTINRDGGADVSHTFTLVVDPGQRSAIVGATSVPITVAGNEIRVAASVYFGIPVGSCGGSVSYQQLSFSIGPNGTITGTGRGQVFTLTGDVGMSVAATMSLTGLPDKQSPTLDLGSDGDIADPFVSLGLYASEPLPLNARPRLLSTGGDDLGFIPPAAPSTFLTSFSGPGVLLRFGEEYQVVVDGIADFAGNTATTSSRFTTGAAPPLLAEDGFESAAAGSVIGRATVIASTDAPTLTGTRSLYIPAVSDGNGRSTSTQLAVRLAIQPTDTTVRFSYRSVTPSNVGSGSYFAVAKVDGKIGGMTLPVEATLTAATIGNTTVMLGPLKTAQIALPADATGGRASEIVVGRVLQAAASPGCSLPPQAVEGIILDDLRVE